MKRESQYIRINLAILLFAFNLISGNLIAQITPVTAIALSNPPHSGNLSEWAAPGLNRLGLSLILNDRNEFSYQVRLEIVIEGQGVRLQTRSNFLPRPITLSYGIPTQISGVDLMEYLDINNLDFIGITRQQYLEQGSLPDGLYSVCFRVFDYDRSETTPVASTACAGVNAIRYDPPLILTPIGPQVPINPQNLITQWQARHPGGFPVQYRLQIFEFDVQSTLSPDLIVLYDQPFVEKFINSVTTALIGPADPPLQPGLTYLIRVQVIDLSMQHQFVNNGWSAPEFFTYGEPCSFPGNIVTNSLGTSSIGVTWPPLNGYNLYAVRYRERDSPGAHWYEDVSSANNVIIGDLLDGTVYEIQVKAICNGEFEGEFSPSMYVETEELNFEEIDCESGSPGNIPLPNNTQPIASLGFGDRVMIGAFEMRIIEIAPSAGGGWQGSGQIRIPWMLNQRYVVTFDDIFVNTQKRVYQGEVKAFSAGLEHMPNWVSPLAVQNSNNGGTVGIFCSTESQGSGLENWMNTGLDAGPLAQSVSDIEGLVSLPFQANSHLGASVLPMRLGIYPNNIVVDNIQFTPTGSTLDAYFTALIPGLYHPDSETGAAYVVFQSLHTGFHPGGLAGENKLELVSDVSAVWQGKVRMTLVGGGGTYINWDCKGVTGIGLHGRVDLCPDLVVPKDNSEFVTGDFAINMPSWGEFSAELSVGAFELPFLPGWTWNVQNLVLDFSESVTPASVQFPEGYTHPKLLNPAGGGEGNPGWTGFYLKNANVQVPSAFYGSSTHPFSIQISQVLIDDTGFSGQISATNLINLDQGSVGSWGASIEDIGIGFQQNQLSNAHIAGQIKIPAFEGNLSYSCIIDVGQQYTFTVGVGDEPLVMNAMVATFELYQNTSLQVSYQQQENKFTANLSIFGKVSLAPQVGPNDGLVMPNLTVENFKVSTEAPFLIQFGTWQFSSGSQNSLAGFPLTINEISLSQTPPDQNWASEVTFVIDAALNLVGQEMGFGIDGRIRLVFNLQQDPTSFRQIWSFNRLRIDRFGLDFDAGAFKFKGSILFYEQVPLYGSGFRGEIEVFFMPGLELKAVAQFGKVNDMRYFFADGLVSWEPGFPLYKTGFSWYGFGGGISFKMRRENFQNVLLPEGEVEGVVPPEVDAEIGRSMSGIRYIPDNDAILGVRASLNIGTVRKELFNGTVGFEIIFNSSVGVQSLGIFGDVQFLTPPKKPGTEPESSIRCKIDMNFDIPNLTFHADLEIFVLAGPIKGAYPENKAGHGVILLSETDYYFWLGTPDQRIQLNYNLANLLQMAKPLAGLIESGASQAGIDLGAGGLLVGGYMNFGNVIPPFPDVPYQVSQILNVDDLRISPDDPALTNGGGLLFGASLELSMPDLSFQVFYASFGAAVGFDMMMRYYGQDARCEGGEFSEHPIGVNGWLAMGQMWAYLQGKIGVDVSIGPIKAKVNILDIAAAAVIQAKMPNPFWMRGIAGGQFSVLGGRLRGSCRFEFEVGEPCKIIGVDELAGIEVIASTQPSESSNEAVDVFVRPQATFNFAIDESFYLEDLEGNTNAYKPQLREFALYRMNSGGQNGVLIPGEIRWNSDKTVIDILPHDVLDGNSQFKLVVKAEFLRSTPDDPSWKVLLNDDGDPVFQEKIVEFVSGLAPDTIPAGNIASAYPISLQFNFLKGQSGVGQITLKQGQPYLFKGNPNWEFHHQYNNWNQKAQFIHQGQVVASADFSYDTNLRRVQFVLPSSQLVANTIYKLSLDNVPHGMQTAVDQDVELVEASLLEGYLSGPGEEGSELNWDDLKALNAQKGYQTKSIYDLSFRTSLYHDFPAKMQALNTSSHFFYPIILDPNIDMGASINHFAVNVIGDELFDRFDQSSFFSSGNVLQSRLIHPEADLSVTPGNWFNNFLYPIMYAHFPSPQHGIVLNRDPSILGDIPTKAVRITQTPSQAHQLSAGQIASQNANIPLPITRIRYELPFVFVSDFADYQEKVANYAANNPIPPAWETFLESDFMLPPSGDYKIVLKYFLPGATTPVSQVPVTIPYGNSN